MVKIVNIEWMRPTREFQCPCCSATTLNADGKVVNKPCSHFLFNWDGDRQDFEDFNDGVESVLDDQSVDLDGPLDQELVTSLPDGSVVFEVILRNEALGPVVRKDVIAFDPMAA